MKLSSDKDTMAELKALILYILYKINKPITNDEFLKLVLTITDINYFYFQQFLLDLVKSEFVISYSQEEQQLFFITEKGKRTLELTEDIIPGILKLQVDTNLKYTLDDVNEENSIVAEYTPLSENYYNVTCKIMENNECLFEVKTFAGSREQAKQIVDNWKRHAGTMYPELLQILTQDFGEEPLEDESEKHHHDMDLGSPRSVYNYDVINRTADEDSENNIDETNNKTTDATPERNNSDVIEGNISLFDMLK